MAQLKFKQIRYDGKEVTLGYLVMSEHGTNEGIMKHDQAPGPEFVDALRAFRPELRKVFGFPGDYAKDCDVVSVAISNKGDKEGIVITAKLSLPTANSPAMLHTPYLPEPGDGDGSGCMTGNMLDKLKRLKACATLYYEGRRAQLDLLAENNGNGRKPQTDIEEEIDEVTRKRTEKDSRKALEQLFATAPSMEALRGSSLTENEVARAILDVFDEVEYVDEADTEKPKWPGVFRYELPNDSGAEGVAIAAWCAVRATNGVARFWFGIVPTENFEAIPATYLTHSLVTIAREIYGLVDPDADADADVADERGIFLEETRPTAEKDDRFSVLELVVHETVAELGDGIDAWMEMTQTERDTNSIHIALAEAFKARGAGKNEYRFTQTIGLHDNRDKLDRIEVAVVVSPLTITIGAGKKQTQFRDDQIVEAARAVFDLFEPAEQEETEDEAELAGAAND